jgi:hypothetical protein
VSAGRPHVFVEKRNGKTVTELAARAMYRIHHGDPGANHVHHTCENSFCVNPDHLVALPPPDHRGLHRGTHCVNGHAYEEHGRVRPRGTIECRRCDYERSDAWRQENREKFREQRREQYRRKRERMGLTVTPRSP